MKLSIPVFTLYLGLLVINSKLFAQQISLNWAAKIGGSLNDEAYAVTEDNNGNVYVTGVFSGTADFNPSDSVTDFRGTGGGEDIFLIKLDADGNFLWGHNIGHGSDDDSYAVISNSNGDVFIAGSYIGSADFDPGPAAAVINSFGNNVGAYIASYDSAGNYRFVINVTGSATSNLVKVNDLCISPNGLIYMTGYYNGTIDLLTSNGPDTLFGNGSQELYLLEILDVGSVENALSWGGDLLEVGYAVSNDQYGNVYLSGTFMDTVDFDHGPGISNLIAQGNRDAFVLKLDASLNYKWAINIGGGSSTTAYGVKTDQLGNVYSTGGFTGTVDFDPGPGTFNLMASSIRFDSYVQKLDSNGNFLWAVSTTSGNTDYGRDLGMDDSANVYVSGYFEGTVDFNPGPATNNLISNSDLSTFVWKLDNKGKFKWAIPFLSNSSQTFGLPVNSLFINNKGNILLTGKFRNTVDFEVGSGVNNLTASAIDAYLIKLTECSPIQTTQKVLACNSFTWPLNNQTYTSTTTARVTLKASNGCDSTVNLEVTILPFSSAVSQNGSILTATQSGAKYQWLDCNDNYAPIPLQNGQVFSPTSNGNYAVEVVYDTSCIDTSICYNVNNVGISTYEKTTEITISPNPTNGEITVFTGNTRGVIIVNIRSIDGRLIKSFKPQQSNFRLKLPEASGLYLLELLNEGNKYVSKVIRE